MIRLDNALFSTLLTNGMNSTAAAPSRTSLAWTRRDFLGLVALGNLVLPQVGLADEPPLKKASVFYPRPRIERAIANAKNLAWAAAIQKALVEAATPWLEMSDDRLWALMFGSSLPRSLMVWSNGYCPACKKDVPMYSWEIDALRRPWKVRCPHCRELFPKNDFAKFYGSGLDEHGVFDPRLADRKLLFNTGHADPKDPLHRFGVDDGTGYAEGDKRWRFVGAYLIYGQWKHAVCGGIKCLSAAYVVTGNPTYAHKAGIILDRVADLFPTFDFNKQAVVYEQPTWASGYVTIANDAREEMRHLAVAYDQVFEPIRRDKALVKFLGAKAKKYKQTTRKESFEDIQRNIEGRLFRDALASGKIRYGANYPRDELAALFLTTVLGWPDNRVRVNTALDQILTHSTRVDGVTGEKGLSSYAASATQILAELLAQYAAIEPTFLRDLLKRHPQLHKTYRFHIDTLCLERYYPLSGDGGELGSTFPRYVGVLFQTALRPSDNDYGNALPPPSQFEFLWRLYELTGDPAFVQVLYQANDKRVEGLPHDIFADDPAALQRKVADVIAREGAELKLASVNKQQWHLAILRGGAGRDARAAWLDYDSGNGNHSHADGMNLGLFARGLDLMPDLGYPPVQFGGWHSPRARWYQSTAAHNTVVVDGRDLADAAGKATLWADGRSFRAVRASAPGMIGGRQFERTVTLIDVSDRDCYVVDLFRVVGGREHTKFVHSRLGRLTTQGLALRPGEPYGRGTQMRNFQLDLAPKPGWSVDWNIEDRHNLLPRGADIHLRYTDLTTGAQAGTAEGWVLVSWVTNETAWIPRVMVRCRAEKGPLASTFVGVLEPYEKQSSISRINRLALAGQDGKALPQSNVAVEVQLADGSRDLLVAADVEEPPNEKASGTSDPALLEKAKRLRVDGEIGFVRLDRDGKIARLALCRGRAFQVGYFKLKLKGRADFIEIRFDEKGASVISGDHRQIEEMSK